MDASGNVIGATATKADGGKLTVNASQVILSTGGFGGNKEMLAEYVPNFIDDATNEGMHTDGSGHQMAWDIGAALGNTGLQVHNNSLPQIALDAGVSTRSGNDVSNIYSVANSPLLWVTREGERFVNEDIMYSATLSGNVIFKEGVVFVVFDQATVDQAMSEGGLGLRAWRGDANVNLENLAKEIEEGIETGYVFKGDTLAQLADNTGMTESTLASAIERYNTLIEKGVDEDYNKAADTLKYSVKNAPYYAIQIAPRFLGTLGGLNVNKNYQVLNTEGRPINGLYATGLNAESWMGSTYVDFSGITMSFALTSGRLAGENAAAALGR